MIVKQRRPDGTPVEAEFTEEELLLMAVHGNLMDLGYDQGTALIMMRGTMLPDGLRDEQAAEMLDPVFTPELVDWMTR